MKHLILFAACLSAFGQIRIHRVGADFRGSVDVRLSTASYPYRQTSSAPSGACSNAAEFVQLSTTGALYYCFGGVWTAYSPPVSVADGSITLAKLAPLTANTMLGNNTGSSATPIALTASQIKTFLAVTASDVGLGNVDNTSDSAKNAATATLTNKTLTAPVINSPTGLVKADVGLGSVDNTADAAKTVALAAALTVNPTACTSGQYVSDIAANGTLTCDQITYLQISGTPTLATVATSGSASDLGTGTIPAARVPTLNQNTTGTAGALAANGANCSAGQFPLGVDASGAAETCTALPTTIAGTANQIAASASTGAIVLSIPTSPTLPGTTTGTFSGPLTGNASTASALAANPTDCSSRQFANAIAASGNLTCGYIQEPLFWVFENGTSVIAAGTPTKEIWVRDGCSFNFATMTADQTGSATVVIETAPYTTGTASWTTVSSGLALSSAQRLKDTTLSGWTLPVAPDTLVRASLSGTPSAITHLTVRLGCS